MRERGRSTTGIASLPHVKLVPNAIVSFAGLGQRGVHFEVWTFSRSSGQVVICWKNADSS